MSARASDGGADARSGVAWASAAAVLALFLAAFLVRLWAHAGFVLGDDAEEFILIRNLVEQGPSFEGHLRYRFPMWAFNYASMRVFGINEAAFFLPTWLISSLLPVLGFATLRAAGVGLAGSAFAGALVALSPFEVLIGSLRANDLFVAFFLAFAFWAFVRFRASPGLQGAGAALGLWLAFYAKLWSVFLLPVLGIHYLLRLVRRREVRGLVAFAGTSALLHGAACAFWRVTTGTWTPFLERLSATYPVASGQLVELFLQYPRYIFEGSEFGNTLFGAVPYLLGVSILGNALRLRTCEPRGGELDRSAFWLLSSCVVFFLLLEFFPNNFTFDRYYSVPRIFRYLAPLSYGLSLLTAMVFLGLAPLLPRRFGLRPLAALAVLVLVAAGIPEAVGPTREHHARVAAIRAALRARCPAAVVIGPAQARFFQQLHLPETCARTAIRRSPIGATVRDAEDWLRRLEPRLEPGAVLVTGLPSYVYYACTDCGLRQSRFAAPLDSRWAPLAELPALAYDEEREPARLWEWRGERAPDSRAAQAATAPMLPAEELFELGIERFDALDYPGTRTYMSAVAERFPRHERAPRAAYFFAVSYWREEDPLRTIREFEALLAEFPESRQEGAAYYHIGLSYRLLHRPEEARVALERAVQEGAPQDPSRGHAARALGGPAGAAPLEAWGRRWTELVYAFHGWPAP